ncbi:hypothetical protein PROFUN_02816 [Planoprotostelium fungivorum]|uniref:Uncharacterized protein n=1 Tax=Planoprotostelium fungivorum TaxID=1890364 RepID=A0A2P6NXN9_9EUKA|nr:hypothetical protein PROFUN_02816 [Planoprotostelium fungivorum]
MLSMTARRVTQPLGVFPFSNSMRVTILSLVFTLACAQWTCEWIKSSDIKLRMTGPRTSFTFTFGAGGTIAQGYDAERSDINIFGPGTSSAEDTDRVVQTVHWDLSLATTVNGESSRWNVNQAGAGNNSFSYIVSAETSAYNGVCQLKVFSVDNQQWDTRIDSIFGGSDSYYLEYTATSDGALTLRRIMLFGQATANGQKVSLPQPYIEQWHTFSNSIFSNAAVAFDAQGNPTWYYDMSNLPGYGNIPVDHTYGYVTAFTNGQATTAFTIVYGTHQLSDCSWNNSSYLCQSGGYVLNSNPYPYEHLLALLPGLNLGGPLRAGDLLDQTFVYRFDKGVQASDVEIYQQSASNVPGPRLFRDYQNGRGGGGLDSIVDQLKSNMCGRGVRTKHLNRLRGYQTISCIH